MAIVRDIERKRAEAEKPQCFGAEKN